MLNGCIVCALCDDIVTMNATTGVIESTHVHQLLHSKCLSFSVYACFNTCVELTTIRAGHGPANFQHDASEFVFALFAEISRCFLASFAFANEQQQQRAELSLPQYRLFGFDCTMTTRCDTCGATTCQLQRQTVLTIALPSSSSPICLMSLLNDVYANERMDGENQFACGSGVCGGAKSTATRTTTIDNSSPVLMLHLLRFTNDAAKIDTPVSFPLVLDIGSFTSDKRPLTYELVRQQESVGCS